MCGSGLRVWGSGCRFYMKFLRLAFKVKIPPYKRSGVSQVGCPVVVVLGVFTRLETP